MAKTIKFNLICDHTPIRTIEDLREHFCIDDLLQYTNNGLLERWLEVRGYMEQLDKIRAIGSTDPLDIAHALIRIFDIPADEEKIRKDTFILTYQEQHAARQRAALEANISTQKTVEEYLLGYAKCVESLRSAPKDEAQIKAILETITSEYPLALAMCHRALFMEFLDASPLIIMCLLMNPQSRKYFIPLEKTASDGSQITDLIPDSDKYHMYKALCERIRTPAYQEKLGGALKKFDGPTRNSNWENLVSPKKKILLLSMEGTAKARPAGDAYTEYTPKETQDKFIIWDGLDYRCSTRQCQLLYMEV